VQISLLFEIPGFRRGVNEVFALLCFHAAFVGDTRKIFDPPKYDRLSRNVRKHPPPSAA
jgi:hypothetical protein